MLYGSSILTEWNGYISSSVRFEKVRLSGRECSRQRPSGDQTHYVGQVKMER